MCILDNLDNEIPDKDVFNYQPDMIDQGILHQHIETKGDGIVPKFLSAQRQLHTNTIAMDAMRLFVSPISPVSKKFRLMVSERETLTCT
jgi:hypothetical protein